MSIIWNLKEEIEILKMKIIQARIGGFIAGFFIGMALGFIIMGISAVRIIEG